MKIKCERVSARELKPGDLFSTAGQPYWDTIDTRLSVGEKVYIRTNTPADAAGDADVEVYRITIIAEEV